MFGKVYESIGKKSPQPRRLCKVSSWTVPPGRKKSRVLDTFLRLLNNEQQPLMTVATAFLVLLVPVAAWIEDEDSIKKEEFGNFWDEGFLLILCFFHYFPGNF